MWGSYCVLATFLVAIARGEMDGYIVGGNYTKLENFPHSVFLSITCNIRYQWQNYACGSSVINQEILLTAAHCIEPCLRQPYIVAFVGHIVKNRGAARSGRRFKLHEDYDPEENSADIALVHLTAPMLLNSMVSRVAVMRMPPYNEPAALAGWGFVQEDPDVATMLLKSVNQTVVNYKECEEEVGFLPIGTICARSVEGHAAQGDSGSALVVRGFIQIGIVSFKYQAIANNLIIYADVGHYYDWINETAGHIACVDQEKIEKPTYLARL